jgi:hypothetical protein
MLASICEIFFISGPSNLLIWKNSRRARKISMEAATRNAKISPEAIIKV